MQSLQRSDPVRWRRGFFSNRCGGVIYFSILDQRYGIQGRFSLPRAKQIAQVRIERMERSLQWLTEESFGIL